ncbi:MAG: hypothetical protein FWG14_08020 [Peptococcaceae bacterium]|nr:hypothetical protein [Peptococcaceae bacterium]
MATTTKRKNLYIVFGVLAIFLLSAIVYAAATGTLFFNGTARLNPDLLLEIEDATITGGIDTANGESCVISGDKQTLTFTVYLEEPNTSREVTFDIRNVGKVDAQLAPLLEVDDTEALAAGLIITWPDSDLEDLIIYANTSSVAPEGPFSIVVEWPSTAPDAASLLAESDYEVTFSASIDYMQYVTP